jgi:hypothetical protein
MVYLFLPPHLPIQERVCQVMLSLACSSLMTENSLSGSICVQDPNSVLLKFRSPTLRFFHQHSHFLQPYIHLPTEHRMELHIGDQNFSYPRSTD